MSARQLVEYIIGDQQSGMPLRQASLLAKLIGQLFATIPIVVFTGLTRNPKPFSFLCWESRHGCGRWKQGRVWQHQSEAFVCGKDSDGACVAVVIWVGVLVRCYQIFGSDHAGIFYGILGETIVLVLISLVVVVCSYFR
uniref:Uncharacterized protein LOC105044930 isoform X2 n=1 Tax=Elaeis guineensis var. tenera TaxID=51953 RepID=A0A8N4IDQ2_ELAGV|nr:uncharacterized protein LOC105044930 isoform X2 [Elaeis guineensis]